MLRKAAEGMTGGKGDGRRRSKRVSYASLLLPSEDAVAACKHFSCFESGFRRAGNCLDAFSGSYGTLPPRFGSSAGFPSSCWAECLDLTILACCENDTGLPDVSEQR